LKSSFCHIAILILLVVAGKSNAQDYAVIVNKANEAVSIKLSSLKRIYLGKMKDWKGQKIIPINLPESDKLAQDFIKKVTRKKYTKYKKYWVAQQIKGEGSAPLEQKSSAAVKLMVSEIPGAIAYIPKKDLDDTVKEIEVK